MSSDLWSDQEKIFLLQKEFHSSQLGLKECGIELQKVRARLLEDLLELEVCHHVNERKAFDKQLSQLQDQFDAARGEIEMIKVTKLATSSTARVIRTACKHDNHDRDILSISGCETVVMPNDNADTRQEASAVLTNLTTGNVVASSLQQNVPAVSFPAVVSVHSDEERTVLGCKETMCHSDKEDTEVEKTSSNETTGGRDQVNNIDAVKKGRRGAKKKKGVIKTRKVVRGGVPDVRDAVAMITDSQSDHRHHTHEDVAGGSSNTLTATDIPVCEVVADSQDINSDVPGPVSSDPAARNSTAPTSVPMATREMDGGMANSTGCNVAKEQNSEGSAATQSTCEEGVIDHIGSVLTGAPLSGQDDVVTAVTNSEGSNENVPECGCPFETSTVPVEPNEEIRGNDEHLAKVVSSTVQRLTSEEHVISHVDSTPAETSVTRKCDAAVSMVTDSQDIRIDGPNAVCMIDHAHSIPAGSPVNQIGDGNDASLSPNTIPNMHLESHEDSFQGLGLITCGAAPGEAPDLQNVSEASLKQEIELQAMDSNVTTMKLQGQKQKSARKKKGVSKGKKKRRPKKAVVAISDSTRMQNKSVDVVVGGSSMNVVMSGKVKSSSPEPSVSSTSNGDVESSSVHKRATVCGDQEFVSAKKLKLEDNPITSPANLVTSTSSDIVGNAVGCALVGGGSRPSVTTDVSASQVEDNPLITDRVRTTRRAGGRRKKRNPKKIQHSDSYENGLESGAVAGGQNLTNTSSSADTTNGTKQNKTVLESNSYAGSTIATMTCIKLEPQIPVSTNVPPPITKNREVSVGVATHYQNPALNKRRKLVSLKSLNRQLMPDISFKGNSTNASVVVSIHNITAPKLKPSVKTTLK